MSEKWFRGTTKSRHCVSCRRLTQAQEVAAARSGQTSGSTDVEALSPRDNICPFRELLHAPWVSWTLSRDDAGFFDNSGRFVVENGRINVYAGNTSSQSDNRASFRVTGGTNPTVSRKGGRR